MREERVNMMRDENKRAERYSRLSSLISHPPFSSLIGFFL
jgi:hypothetical protein